MTVLQIMCVTLPYTLSSTHKFITA